MKKIAKLSAIVLAFAMVLTIFSGCSIAITPEQKLIGSWRDSTGSIGYDFYDNGTATVHYADFVIPIINYKYDGQLSATYSTVKADDGSRHINLHYTIIGSISVDEDFIFNIEGGVLTITNVNTNKTFTLTRYDASSATAPQNSASASAQ